MSFDTPLEECLEKHFGFSTFRDPQREIIQGILQGRDSLVVLPTGGGKSLCYQLPALLMDGLTLVVSPLIALMKDQVDVLRSKNLPVAVLHSMQPESERRSTLSALENGDCKLLYVSPERFQSRGFLDLLKPLKISLFAIDEAHCLSQWGHDFRPDYLRLNKVLEALDHPPVAAFTATATPLVRKDIQDHLKLRSPAVIVSGFARPNLTFRVRPTTGEVEKMQYLVQTVRRLRTGIVYCATRKKVDKVSRLLNEEGVKVLTYHGGMDAASRERAQNQFMNGNYPVVVATNAFGMGIDRSDIRFVVHFELPGSVEAYYQEAGRAGRDGSPAECELYFNFADRRTQEFFIEGANPSASLMRQIYSHLQRMSDAQNEVKMSMDDLSTLLPERTNPMAVSTAVHYLQRISVLERFDLPGQMIRGTRLLQPKRAAADLPIDDRMLQLKKQRDMDKLDKVVAYAENFHGCRQKWILDYFGEEGAEACGLCDLCLSREDPDLRPPTEEEQTIARKALSGVARMSERAGNRHWLPRFGKAKIIRSLLGEAMDGAYADSLEKLSTFGILSSESRKFVQALFRELEKRHYLTIDRSSGFPLTTLTERGVEVLLEGKSCHLDWDHLPNLNKKRIRPRDTKKKKTKLDEEVEKAIRPLLQQLKDKRRAIAIERGVPAFTIFHDDTLVDLARKRPQTVEEALRIKGIGPAKAEKELPEFLSMLRET